MLVNPTVNSTGAPSFLFQRDGEGEASRAHGLASPRDDEDREEEE